MEHLEVRAGAQLPGRIQVAAKSFEQKHDIQSRREARGEIRIIVPIELFLGIVRVHRIHACIRVAKFSGIGMVKKA